MDEKLIEAVRCFPCLWQTMSKAYKDLRARESATTSKSLKSSSTSIVTLSHHAVAPIRTRGYKGCGRRTSRSLPLKTNIVNTDAACGASRRAAPRRVAVRRIVNQALASNKHHLVKPYTTVMEQPKICDHYSRLIV